MENHHLRLSLFILAVLLLSIGLILIPSSVLVTVAPLAGTTYDRTQCPSDNGPLVKFRSISSGPQPGNTSSADSHKHGGDEFWNSLIPLANGGFITVQEANGTKTAYGISVYHQLHCLLALREVLFPDKPMGQGPSAGSGHKAPHSHVVWHWHHCFDYLAQSIICSADDTIETPHKIVNYLGNEVMTVDGIGQIHQCRDPNPLWETVLKTRQNPLPYRSWKDGEGVRSWLSHNSNAEFHHE